MLAGIDLSGQQLARLRAPASGLLQQDVGIDTQGDPFLLAPEAVFQPPLLAAAGGDFRIQSATVKYFPGLVTGLSMTDGDVGKGHMPPAVKESLRSF